MVCSGIGAAGIVRGGSSMSKWSWWFVGWVITGVILWVFSPAHAEDLLPKPGTWSLGVKAGYSFSIDNKGVDMAHANLHIGYTLFSGQWWVVPAGAFELGVEPFGSAIVHLKKKTASGATEYGLGLPILTYYFDLGYGVAPYLTGGLGSCIRTCAAIVWADISPLWRQQGLGSLIFW